MEYEASITDTCEDHLTIKVVGARLYVMNDGDEPTEDWAFDLTKAKRLHTMLTEAIEVLEANIA